jgi:diacylglycerol kinase (ATP)
MSGIGVVLNPHSRSNRLNPERAERLSFIVGDKGSCHATQDVPDLKEVAEEFAQREIEILCISGGDGTIHHSLSAVIETYGDRPLPRIAFLRGGTVNNVANAIGMNGTPEAILSRLIVGYHKATPLETTPLHCLEIEGQYGFLFGNGFACTFIEEYIRLGEGGGSNLSRLISRQILSAIFNTPFIHEHNRRYDADVTVDGKIWPFKNYTALSISTVEPCGIGFRPYHRAREKPDHFHAIGYSLTPCQLLAESIRVWLGKMDGSENRLDAVAKEVVIVTGEPMTYTIDGEIYPPTSHLTIRCGPALNVVIV